MSWVRCLVERAAECHVDELCAAADAEHRLAGLDELVHELDLVDVAQAVAGPFGRERLLAIGRRADVGAALEHQAVERAGIVGETHVAAVEQAVLVARGHHKH